MIPQFHHLKVDLWLCPWDSFRVLFFCKFKIIESAPRQKNLWQWQTETPRGLIKPTLPIKLGCVVLVSDWLLLSSVFKKHCMSAHFCLLNFSPQGLNMLIMLSILFLLDKSGDIPYWLNINKSQNHIQQWTDPTIPVCASKVCFFFLCAIALHCCHKTIKNTLMSHTVALGEMFDSFTHTCWQKYSLEHKICINRPQQMHYFLLFE